MKKRLTSALSAVLKKSFIPALSVVFIGLLFVQIESPSQWMQARVLSPNYTKNLLAEIEQIRTEEQDENSRYPISERYKYEIVDQGGTTIRTEASTDADKEITLKVTLKNTGKSSWFLTEGVENQLVLGAYPQDRPTPFSSEKIQIKDKNGKEIIGPDETTTFEITLKSPEQAGIYIEEFAPLISGSKWLNNEKLSWQIIVEGDFSESFNYQIASPGASNAESITELNKTVPLNTETEIEIKLTNLSQTTWYGGDASGKTANMFPLQLIADDEITAQTLGIYSEPVATMKESKVAPGETATFTFSVYPPSITGSYRLRLKLSIADLFTLNKDPVDVNILAANKVVALTIDDGYGDIEDFIEVLAENNVRATFFMLGVVAQSNPEGMKKIVESGNLLANHSYLHPNFRNLSANEIRNQLNTTRQIMIDATGFDPYPYFRYPGGDHNATTDKILEEDGWKYFQWTNGTGDFKYRANTAAGRSHILYYATANAPDKAIVLLHTMSQSTVAVLPDIINFYRDRGYAFVTVDEL